MEATMSVRVMSKECNPIVYIHYQRKSKGLSNIIIVAAVEVGPLEELHQDRQEDLKVLPQ